MLENHGGYRSSGLSRVVKRCAHVSLRIDKISISSQRAFFSVALTLSYVSESAVTPLTIGQCKEIPEWNSINILQSLKEIDPTGFEPVTDRLEGGCV